MMQGRARVIGGVGAVIAARRPSNPIGGIFCGLGPIGVRTRGSEPLTPADEKLVSELAAQAGLVLRNVRRAEAMLDELGSETRAALEAQARKSTVPVRIEARGVGRYARDVKLEVRDDGLGFDTNTVGSGTGLQGMVDRLDALGGSLTVDNTAGLDTTVTGSAPAAETAP